MDTIAQFLTHIRNAGAAKHEKMDIPSSKVREGIAKILIEEGYVRSFKVANDSKQGLMRLYLKYNQKGDHVIQSIQRVSKPGKRVYINSQQIPVIRSGYGMVILSTSKGIMSGKKAKDMNLGGEFVCKIW